MVNDDAGEPDAFEVVEETLSLLFVLSDAESRPESPLFLLSGVPAGDPDEVEVVELLDPSLGFLDEVLESFVRDNYTRGKAIKH